MKSEIRNPKSEGSPKAEARNGAACAPEPARGCPSRSTSLAKWLWRISDAVGLPVALRLGQPRAAFVIRPSCLLLASLVVLGFTLLATGCSKSADHADHTAAAAKYHCPMHPTYVSDRPGDCPICKMALVLIKGGGASTSTNGIAGRATIAVSPEKQQLIGVRFAEVRTQELSRVIRTTAVVAHDETRQATISPRFAGWVRKLHVNYTGQHVEKGAPLLTVYSPELLAAESEYLLAYQRFAKLKVNASDPQHDAARTLTESARHRLALWEIGDAEIVELEKGGQPRDEVLLRSPVSGHVLTRNATVGKSFMMGETLYTIEDLSRVWLRTTIYESDFPRIKVGQKARVIFPALTTMGWESEVTFIDPHIDPATRRGEVRLELDNPTHRLRPDMWAEVEIEMPLGEMLAVPASAVIDTGTRTLAFVRAKDNHFEPREVTIGARLDDWWEVESGLAAGEQVVERALFLIDSESQLKAAIAGMAGEHKH